MSRTVPEWIGKTDDTAIPTTVQLRIWNRCAGHCEICTRKIMAGEVKHFDHIVPLADGGENRESNLQVACVACHGRKTSGENRARARVHRKAKATLGLRPKKAKPFPGGKDSRFKRCVDGTVIDRRTGEVL